MFRVPSLDIPDPERPQPPERLADYEAVSLFVERAAAASPGFVLDEENADDVARICLRLDGLPLALELAAARLGALSTAAIAARLDDRFRLLRSGSHAAPTRQQTLTATLQWSHDLLEPDERVLLRRLAIFAGGFELEAVEDVCAVDGIDAPEIADVLARLVEKSLVAVEDRRSPPPLPAARDRQALRARAARRRRRDAALADRHARWALALAERERDSPRLDRESANLRAALDTLLAREPDDRAPVLRRADAVLAAPDRARGGEAPLRDGARGRTGADAAAAPRRCSPRRRSTSGAARSRTAWRSRRRAMPSRSRSAIAARNGGRSSSSARSASRATRRTSPSRGWSARSRSRARKASPPPRRSASTRSGSRTGCSATCADADRLLDESIAGFRALEDSAETIPSPLNIAEIRTDRLERRPGVQLLFEDTLQPFVEVSCGTAVSYALANQAGVARGLGDLARAHALLDESRARFEAAEDDSGSRDGARARRVYLASSKGISRRRAGSCRGRSSCARGCATAAGADWRSPGSV